MNIFNVYKTWCKNREKHANIKAEGKHLALLASGNIDFHRAYRQKMEKDVYGFIRNGKLEIVSYNEYKKRTAQKIQPFEHLGGIITFSADITHKTKNDQRVPIKSIVDKILAWIQTHANRLFVSKKVDKAVKDAIEHEVGFSLGNFFVGKYVDNQGNVFNEKSISLDIKGIDSEELEKLAGEVCEEFNQNSVLVEDRNKNSAYLYNAKG